MPRIVMLLAAVILLAACAPAAPSPALPPEATAETAATPAPVFGRFEDIPQSATGQGLPQAGFPNAPVSVSVFAAFDDPGSVALWADTSQLLADRARTGEILVTYLPLFGEGTPNARGAARAAVCAGEQSGFWAYAERLFAAVAAEDSAAFDGARLVALADEIGMDGALWNACMVSDRPDFTLSEAARLASQTEWFTAAPLVLVDGLASLPDAESLDFTIDRALTLFQESLNLALTPGATPEVPGVAETPAAVTTIEPLMDDALVPPIEITLPEGWDAGFATLLLQDLDGPRGVPVAVYSGPVTGGQGTILLLWGFPNVVAPGSGDEPLYADLWLDGLRLLRLAVVEPACNIGTGMKTDYVVGGLAAVGATFAAVDCPELPDTRGWFAGQRQYGLNFVFFAYTDPIAAMDGPAADELAAALESVVFQPVPQPTTAP